MSRYFLEGLWQVNKPCGCSNLGPSIHWLRACALKAKLTNFFVRDAGVKIILRSVVARLAHLITFVFARRRFSRYLLLTPAACRHQVLFDRRKRARIRLIIRDMGDFFTMAQIYLSEDYGIDKLKRNHDILDLYRTIVNSGKMPLILDCGGNIGLATKYFSSDYEKAKIICIEPDRDNLCLAKINNMKESIDFLQCAVGSESGVGRINDLGLGNNAYRMKLASDGDTKIISISDLLQLYPPTSYVPFIIKIDIEGFESELFSKNTDWVEAFPLLIIELHDWMLPKSANATNFLRCIACLDRDFVYHGENIFSISNTLL